MYTMTPPSSFVHEAVISDTELYARNCILLGIKVLNNIYYIEKRRNEKNNVQKWVIYLHRTRMYRPKTGAVLLANLFFPSLRNFPIYRLVVTVFFRKCNNFDNFIVVQRDLRRDSNSRTSG